jgi:hypothetical protein
VVNSEIVDNLLPDETIYEIIYEEQERHVKYTSLLANCMLDLETLSQPNDDSTKGHLLSRLMDENF